MRFPCEPTICERPSIERRWPQVLQHDEQPLSVASRLNALGSLSPPFPILSPHFDNLSSSFFFFPVVACQESASLSTS
eukprot:3940507-Rhodomonas_salina.2